MNQSPSLASSLFRSVLSTHGSRDSHFRATLSFPTWSSARVFARIMRKRSPDAAVSTMFNRVVVTASNSETSETAFNYIERVNARSVRVIFDAKRSSPDGSACLSRTA